MKRRAALVMGLVLSPAMAHAESAIPQSAPSPWSLHQAVDAPSNLKLTATFRTRIETIDGQARPGLNASDSLIDLRTTLFAEYQTGPLRLGAELIDSRAYGGDLKTPIGTNDVNVAELVQAYAALDIPAPFGAGTKARLQAGRMTLNMGSRRIVSSEDWRNTTNGYTGLRGDIVLPKGLTATAFYMQPTLRLPDDRPRLLDNAHAADQESPATVLWGGLANRARFAGGVSGELSFYHFEERDRVGRPSRDRRLDTYGGRIYREPAPGRSDFEVEVFHQTGEISRSLAANASRQSVAADFVHAEVGHSFVAPWKPRLSVRFDLASGDRGGSHYGRFDTLYGMRGAELAQAGLYSTVGRANLVSPAVVMELAPDRRDDVLVRYRPLWLASRTDSFSTSNVRDPNGRSGDFAGHQLEARWRRWLVPDALRLEVNGIYLAKGRFLKDAPNAPRTGDTAFGVVSLTSYF